MAEDGGDNEVSCIGTLREEVSCLGRCNGLYAIEKIEQNKEFLQKYPDAGFLGVLVSEF